MGDADTMPLEHAIDTHVHTSPDVLPRSQSAVQVARSSARAHMSAVVLKNHHVSTVGLAHAASEVVSELRTLGGLVLNTSACGGFNPHAVEAALAMGARIVWMPTISARNHIEFLRSGQASDHIAALSQLAEDGLSPLGQRKKVSSEVIQIMDMVAERQAVLATGHLSADETCELIDAAHRCGVARVLVTHPEAPQIRMSIDVQRDLASRGAMFERCYYSILAGGKPSGVLDDIRAVGTDSTVLATDLGQAHYLTPVEGFCAYRQVLEAGGFTDEDWHAMAVENPARVFGLSGT